MDCGAHKFYELKMHFEGNALQILVYAQTRCGYLAVPLTESGNHYLWIT